MAREFIGWVMAAEGVLSRAVKYFALNVVSLLINLLVFRIGLWFDTSMVVANAVAFAVGGQINFWVHDRFTFGDRHPTLQGAWRRWALFMPGNISALFINSLAAGLLALTGLPILVVYVAALATSGAFNFWWNNWVSHRGRSDSELSIDQSVERSIHT